MPVPASTMKGRPVPSLPVCRFDQIESFRPGYWNGEHFTADFISKAVENFNKMCAGPRPWYRPWVSVNHDKTPHLKGLRMGRLLNPTVGPDGILRLDAVNVPGEVGTMRNTGMLSEPSIEFIRPKIDPQTGKKTGFVGPDGRIVDGPMIKCLTFLGADMPAVHGMSELPTAMFCFTGGEVLSFSYGAKPMQTRDQMLQALQALNINTDWVTDQIPDEVLSTILTLIQNANAAAKPAADANPQPQFADATAGALGALGLTGAAAPAAAGDGRLPTSIQTIQKFSQQNPGLIETIVRAATAGQAQQNKRLDEYEAAQRRHMTRLKEDALTSFFSQMSDSGQVTPAMAKGLRPMLLALDNVTVSAFAVGDKSVQTTAFDAALANIRADYPVLRNFDRKAAQPPVSPPAGGGGPGQRLTPEQRARILGGANNPEGRAALAKYNARNSANN